jgi:hypothetical protein
MGTGSSQGVNSGRGVTLTTHPLLAPTSWKSRGILLTPLWATTVPVTGLLYLLNFPNRENKLIPSGKKEAIKLESVIFSVTRENLTKNIIVRKIK